MDEHRVRLGARVTAVVLWLGFIVLVESTPAKVLAIAALALAVIGGLHSKRRSRGRERGGRR